MQKRLFFSIPLPEPTQILLETYCKLFDLNDVRCVTVFNLHITLFFIGNVDELKIQDLIQSYNAIIPHHNAFYLSFKHITFAPPQDPGRMIWIEFENNDYYQKLVDETKKIVMQIFGNAIEQENLKSNIPHVTLARCIKPHNFKSYTLKQVQIPDLCVDSIQLIESKLSQTGSIYDILHTFIL